jgi:peptidyl-Lys metalloendopeptidase
MIWTVFASLLISGNADIFVSLGESHLKWHVDAMFTVDQNMVISDRNTMLDSPLFACGAFHVYDHSVGRLVENTGARARRTPPTTQNDIEVLSGETVIRQVDLSKCFAFEKDHSYEITARQIAIVTQSKTDTVHSWKQLEDNSHFFVPSTSSSPLELAAATRQGKSSVRSKVANYQNCNDEEIAASDSATFSLANALDIYLPTFTMSCAYDSQYTTWFGEYDYDRYYSVYTNFDNVLSFFDDNYIIHCNADDCEDGVYAYVYPSDPTHTIVVCGAYFDSGNTLDGSADTKPGTLAHEASHFVDVADTNDHVYGTASAEALAISDPCRALNNADNYAYYLELGDTASPPSSCCDSISDESDCNASPCAWNNGLCLAYFETTESSRLGSCASAWNPEYDDCTDLTVSSEPWVDSSSSSCFEFYWNDGTAGDWCDSCGVLFKLRYTIFISGCLSHRGYGIVVLK